jgi:flagellar biosynthetic protein FliQ
MDPDLVMELGRQTLQLTVLLAAPILLVSLVVGLVIAMFQAATQINEMTLSFVPKLLVIAVVLVWAGPWMLRLMTDLTADLFERIPGLVG